MVHARIAVKVHYDPGGPSSRENYEHNGTTVQARTREGGEKKKTQKKLHRNVHSQPLKCFI